MHDYNKVIQELIRLGIIDSSEIFDYEFSPLKEIYQNYFDYCQENLLNHCHEYNIQPARFFFSNNYGVNAKAGLIKDYFVIGVNMDTIHTAYELFYEQNNIFDENPILSEMFLELSDKLDVPFGFLMFQMTTLFTYHHELAHLVQKSSLLETGFHEQYGIGHEIEYSIEKHVLEFDADIQGANAICFQLLEYFKKLPNEDQTIKNLSKLMSLGITSIFSYFLICFNKTKNLYYKKFSHPHPLIRICYVLDCFVAVVEENFPFKNVKLKPENLIRFGFSISDIFFRSKTQYQHLTGEFQSQFIDKTDGIEYYINELLEYSKTMKNLMINRK